MKRAIIFYPHIGEYGGIERNIIALSIGIKSRGLIPVLICFYDHINMSQYVEGLETIQLGDHWNPIVKARTLAAWLKENKDSYVGLPFFFGAKAGFYALPADVEYYALHYTDPPSLLTKGSSSPIKNLLLAPRRMVSDWFMLKGVTRAKARITMTKWNARELKEVYGESFEVVYQGGVPASGIINEGKRCAGKTLKLFSICRIASSKNLTWIIEAAAYLKNQKWFASTYDSLEVIIAGKGPQEQELKEKVQDLQLSDVIRFPGFLTPEALEEAYRTSDVFLVPGRQGYGLPVLEALYRYLPVVLNKESRISELLTEHPWCAVTENSSASFQQQLEQHIRRLKENYPSGHILEKLPTEETWAIEIGKKCLWWK